MSGSERYFELPDEETLGKLTEGELCTLIQINESHMCHVESEKLGLIKIYVAVVSFVMATLFIEGLHKSFRVFLLFFVVVMGCIVYALSVRWSHVFDNHKKILSSLVEQVLKNENVDIEKEKQSDLNRYFLFNNRRYAFVDKKEDIKRIVQGKKYKPIDLYIYKLKKGHLILNEDGSYHYVGTGTLISLFVGISVIFALLLMIYILVVM